MTSYLVLSAYQALGPKRLSPYVTWTTGNEWQIKYIGYLPNISSAVCRNKPIRYKQDSITKAMIYCNECFNHKKNMSSEYHWSNNVSQFQCIKWIDTRQPQTNHSQHGVKPVAVELRASSADEERRPVSELWQTECDGNRSWWRLVNETQQFICKVSASHLGRYFV